MGFCAISTAEKKEGPGCDLRFSAHFLFPYARLCPLSILLEWAGKI